MHFCNNYIGGHYCSCKIGYLLDKDKKSCIGKYTYCIASFKIPFFQVPFQVCKLSPSLNRNIGALRACSKNDSGLIQLFRSNDERYLSVCTTITIIIMTINVVVMMMMLMTTMIMMLVGRGDCVAEGRGGCGGRMFVVVLIGVVGMMVVGVVVVVLIGVVVLLKVGLVVVVGCFWCW